MFVAPATLYIFTKFQPWIPTQSKMALILSNLADYPLPGLKCTLKCWCLTTPSTLPHISVYETSPKTLRIKVTNHREKKWGITSTFTLCSWLTCMVALPHVSRRQCHVSSSVAKIVLHVKKSAYILKMKIKCYRSDVWRLPSYMAHALQHVHTFNPINFSLEQNILVVSRQAFILYWELYQVWEQPSITAVKKNIKKLIGLKVIQQNEKSTQKLFRHV